MRRLASTVTIVTARNEGLRHGMTATAVTSLTTSPPSLLVCINRSASILHDPIGRSGQFCVNLLACDHDHLVPVFSGKVTGEERFASGEWKVDETGIPCLANAQANLFCKVVGTMSHGSHSIFIGDVGKVVVFGAPSPLLYHEGALFKTHTRSTPRCPSQRRGTSTSNDGCRPGRSSESKEETMSNLDAYRAAGNPLFNGNKLKLGIFGPNCSNACAITMAETSFEPTFEKNLEIAGMLEQAGFECMVPIARWRGFGGPSNFNGNCMETYTWASALAARTRNIFLFATSHVPTLHPIVAAKMATTIDHISKGRFGLNMVCGWFTPEMEMFGVKMMEHDNRYEYATEWVEVLEKLWTEEWFDHKGEHFTINQGFSDPKPYQKPRPVLISAGSSPKGREFAARFCDINFSVVENIEKGSKWVDDYEEAGLGAVQTRDRHVHVLVCRRARHGEGSARLL